MNVLLGIYLWGDVIGLTVGDPRSDKSMELATTNLFNAMGFITIDDYAGTIPGFRYYSTYINGSIASSRDWCIKCEVEDNKTVQRLFVLFSRLWVTHDGTHTTIDDSICRRYEEGTDDCQFVIRPTKHEVRCAEGYSNGQITDNDLWFCSDWVL